jgi:ATP-binding cassette, subfamily B, multidrug efflux pump
MATDKTGRFDHLIPILKRYSGYFWFGTLATIFANSLVLVIPYLTKLAFEAIQKGHQSAVVFKLSLAMVILATVAGVFRFFMRRSIIWASRKIEYDLRGALFSKMLTLDPGFYHTSKTGDLMAHATNDIEAVRMMIGPGVMQVVNAVVSTIVSLGFMIMLSPKLTLATVLPLTLLSLIVNRIGTLAHKKYQIIQAHFSYLTTRVQENLAGMRVIKAYRREDSEIDRFGDASRTYIGMNLNMMRLVGLFGPLLAIIVGGVTLMVLFVGGREIMAQHLTLGTLVAFFGYMSWLTWPIMALGWVISLYQRGTASLDRINKILNTQPLIIDPGKSKTSPAKVKGKIEFRNLTFGYPQPDGTTGAPILSDINLTIESGTRLGIIGPTGSGKTTLVSLISRLYPTEAGRLLIDDIDIRLWPLAPLRRGIGFVPQETFLFSDTLEANIDFSAEESRSSRVVEAAMLAALHDEVEGFPQRYETILGERGITLSGGQKQRTALARAIMKQPAVVILDDATSSVDTETEEKIFGNLEKVLPGRTSIIISHRVSSLKGCHRIIYLAGGRIVEEGTHDELLAKNGPYAALYRRQLMEAELEKM